MSDQVPSDEEFGRRLSAARGYRREKVKDFAPRVEVDRTTLPRYEAGAVPAERRAWLVDQYVKHTGLPAEFFSIDLQELPLMVDAWRQAERLEHPRDLERVVDQALEGKRP